MLPSEIIKRYLTYCITFISASFEVTINDTLVFSKLKLNAFPTAQDVSTLFLFLAAYIVITHMFWNLGSLFKWAFLIACHPLSVCLSVHLFVVRLSVNFSHFHLLLQNYKANFNQTWDKASLGESDSSLFK